MAEVIVALDVPNEAGALDLVDRLGEDLAFVKVGLELYTREGPAVVRRLRERGLRVFLDLKLHDIPRTVEGAVQAAVDLDVDLLTVHAAGGRGMVQAAVAAVGTSRLRILAVTALTSLLSEDLEEIWGRPVSAVEREVVRLASLAWNSGVHGVVASPQEAAALRAELGPSALLVTPGIRSAFDLVHDQARVATPADAVAAGADFLVVGRPVTASPDPRAALLRLGREMAEARGTRAAEGGA